MENETVIHHVLRMLEWGRVSNVVKLLIYTMLHNEEKVVEQPRWLLHFFVIKLLDDSVLKKVMFKRPLLTMKRYF